MILEGPLDEIIVLVDLSLYCRYINKNSKGNPLLYVNMCKALYGMLRSALLFYRKLVKELEEYGFEINLYDPCVANNMVNGSQRTVVWHVDYLEVSSQERV